MPDENPQNDSPREIAENRLADLIEENKKAWTEERAEKIAELITALCD